MSAREHEPEAVVMGASDGAVEALSLLLPALPLRLALPVVVVVHIPQDRPSHLPELFRQRCGHPVREAEDKAPLERGVVYFAPPGYHLLIERTRAFALSTEPPVHYSRPSIDVLFESAAEAYGPGLLGILLTGANSDGAAGLKAIRQAGGETWVQDPASAKSPAMPAAALAAGAAKQVMGLEQMAGALGGLRTSSAMEKG